MLPLLDNLVSLSESTKSFISSISRISLEYSVKIPSNKITSAGYIEMDSDFLGHEKKFNAISFSNILLFITAFFPTTSLK